mmetsp:Transcript_6853/g.13783  ORF Transcript_6853/g.13783 Transcript_6853/m.13783 type:complete len:139 (+) Transcript_6853:290-706(+)
MHFFPVPSSLSSPAPSMSLPTPCSLYLAADAEGGGRMQFSTDGHGATAAVEGEAGDALLLYNLTPRGHSSGQTDPLAAYAMSQVTAGEKCMAVVHFHNKLRMQDQYNADHSTDKYGTGASKSHMMDHDISDRLGKLPT